MELKLDKAVSEDWRSMAIQNCIHPPQGYLACLLPAVQQHQVATASSARLALPKPQTEVLYKPRRGPTNQVVGGLLMHVLPWILQPSPDSTAMACTMLARNAKPLASKVQQWRSGRPSMPVASKHVNFKPPGVQARANTRCKWKGEQRHESRANNRRRRRQAHPAEGG